MLTRPCKVWPLLDARVLVTALFSSNMPHVAFPLAFLHIQIPHPPSSMNHTLPVGDTDTGSNHTFLQLPGYRLDWQRRYLFLPQRVPPAPGNGLTRYSLVNICGWKGRKRAAWGELRLCSQIHRSPPNLGGVTGGCQRWLPHGQEEAQMSAGKGSRLKYQNQVFPNAWGRSLWDKFLAYAQVP